MKISFDFGFFWTALIVVSLVAAGCAGNNSSSLNQLPSNSRLTDRSTISKGEKPGGLVPVLETARLKHSPAYPAILVNPNDPSQSLIFGVNLNQEKSSLVAFDLDGKPIQTIEGLNSPSAVDAIGSWVLVAEPGKVRLFSVDWDKRLLVEGTEQVDLLPELTAGERTPTALSMFQRSSDKAIFVTVAFSKAAQTGILAQYRLVEAKGQFDLKLVRRFAAAPSESEQPSSLTTNHESGVLLIGFPKGQILAYPADPEAEDADKPIPSLFPTVAAAHLIYASHDPKSTSVVSVRVTKSETIFSFLDPSVKTASLPGRSLNLKFKSHGLAVFRGPVTQKFPNGLIVIANEASKALSFYDLGAVFSQLGVPSNSGQARSE